MFELLDTNTCVEYLRGRDARVLRRFAAIDDSDLRLCSIVEAELYYGAYRSRDVRRNLAEVALFVDRFASLAFDAASAREYGRLRSDLASRGLLIGPHDLQIAAIALVHGLTLVTHNTREFSNVPGLMLDDWQASP